MISSALKTLDYFENHLSEMVTDVAVGARIMEGKVFYILVRTADLIITNTFITFLSFLLNQCSATKYSVENKTELKPDAPRRFKNVTT